MQATQPDVKLISKAADCNIKIFIACMFDGNLQSLVIEGEATDEMLQATWNAIHIEYTDMSGADIPELASIKAIYALQCHIKVVELYFIAATDCCKFYGQPFMEEIPDIIEQTIQKLKGCGIRLVWKDNQTDFFDQINRQQIKFKINYIRLEKLMKELEIEREIEKKKRPTSENDVTMFYSLLNNLEMAGYRIDENTTSIARLAVMIKDHKARIERQERMN